MYTSLAKENQGHVGSIQEVQGCIDSIKLHDRPNFSSLQVCDQLRTSFEPDSVMEFGFEPVCNQLRAGSSYLDT